MKRQQILLLIAIGVFLPQGVSAAEQKSASSGKGSPRNCVEAAALLNAPADDEEAKVRQIIKVCPELADAHASMGTILLKKKNFAEAKASFERAIALHEDATFISGLGSVAAAQGDSPEAESQFQRALSVDPSCASALQGLAAVDIQKGQLAEAEQLLRRAAQITPEDPVIFFNFGVVLSREGKLDEAAASFRAALDRKPDYAEAREQLTRALLRQSRFDEAEVLLRQALNQDNSDALAGVMLASVLEARGEFKPAEKILLAIEAKEPDRSKKDPVMRLARAVLRIKRGKMRDGMQMLEELKRSPQASSLPPGRLSGAEGWAYLQQGEVSKALELLKEALKTNPEDQLARMNLEIAQSLSAQ